MSKEARTLTVLVLILLAFGIVILFSTSAIYTAENPKFGDPYAFFKKQLLWVALGLVGLVAAASIPYAFWDKTKIYLCAAAFVLLVLVLVPGIGAKVNHARRWFRFGGLSLQPSEFARLALCIFLAGFISKSPDRIKRFYPDFCLCMLVILSTGGLMFLEPDMGTALFVSFVFLLMLTISGAKLPHLAAVMGVLIPLAFVVVLYKSPYVLERIRAFGHSEPDPSGRGYHVYQSLIALGSGGFSGVGLGAGTQKLFYLPEGHSDFIFSVIGEELGWLGTCFVIALFLGIIYTGWKICQKTQETFPMLLSFGLLSFIALQALFHMAVTTAMIPAKGIPLPFLSMGGSSLFFTLFEVGILVNIANHPTTTEPK